MRIAIDIDSTLHHYWDVLSAPRGDRFGVDLPVRVAAGPGASRCCVRDQLRLCVQETHRDAAILAASRIPMRSRRSRAWREAGPLHPHHEPPGRRRARSTATVAGADRRALRRSVLLEDKVARCREIGIDLLVDDSPVNIARAVDAGIAVATIATRGTATCARTRTRSAQRDWTDLRRGSRRCWSLRTTGPERRAQLFPPVRHEPVPASLHAHQFPRRGRYRLPSSISPSLTNFTDETSPPRHHQRHDRRRPAHRDRGRVRLRRQS